MKKIIGREVELGILEDSYQSKEAEFIALYGRRRVGKTYLIRTYFEAKKDCIFFYVTGTKEGSLAQQLSHFTSELAAIFLSPGFEPAPFKSWDSAFQALIKNVKQSSSKKIVLFFDEFPWMVSRRSKLMETLEYYWNRHLSMDPRVKFIICGSAAGWILKHVIHNRGGLYNRVTQRIHLEPFSLYETKKYLKYKKVALVDKDIVDLYMVIGGIPFYLSKVKPGLSVPHIVETLGFKRDSFLLSEFDDLYATLFNAGGMHVELARIIAQKRSGISRAEIEKIDKRLASGGRLTTWLKDLEQAGFIARYTPYGSKKKGIYYKMEDEYSLFYFYWVEPIKSTLLERGMTKGYWERQFKSQSWRIWSGYAFETICMKHISVVNQALHLGPGATPSTWRFIPKKDSVELGAQIDLLFERDDNSITICEIKYTKNPFVLDKEQMAKIWQKVDVFKEKIKTEKNIFIAFISAYGMKKTAYFEEFIHGLVTLKDFFKPPH